MSGGYYDIDSILATHQKVPCKFKFDVPDFGLLESSDTKDIKEGSCIDLPYWLAELLAIRETIDIERPKTFSDRLCNALKADPRSVNLRAQATYFYAFAVIYLEWSEKDDLLDVMVDTFRSRVAYLTDLAHNPRGALAEGMEFLKGLEETERALFKASHENAAQSKRWTDRPRET